MKDIYPALGWGLATSQRARSSSQYQHWIKIGLPVKFPKSGKEGFGVKKPMGNGGFSTPKPSFPGFGDFDPCAGLGGLHLTIPFGENLSDVSDTFIFSCSGEAEAPGRGGER